MAEKHMLPPPLRIQTHQSPPPPSSSSSSSSSYTSFPILAISILGILTTAILLVSYYVFVIKCCLNWRHVDVLGRLSVSRSRRHRRREQPPFAVYASTTENRGLEESVIRAIPTIRFRKGEGNCESKSLFHECAVCLCEFQEEEVLRLLPNCSHAFHIDCIDTWLQTNANCPLCRSDIASTDPVPYDQFFFTAHCPHQLPIQNQSAVIEVRDDNGGGSDMTPVSASSVQSSATTPQQHSPSPRKLDQRFQLPKKVRKLNHVSSMGDECIDVRGKDEQFSSIQPIRRSISMDSSTDRQLYKAVQEILRQQQSGQFQDAAIGEGSSSSGTGGSSRIRRSFFSFGHGRSSRNAVQPIQFDL